MYIDVILYYVWQILSNIAMYWFIIDTAILSIAHNTSYYDSIVIYSDKWFSLVDSRVIPNWILMELENWWSMQKYGSILEMVQSWDWLLCGSFMWPAY